MNKALVLFSGGQDSTTCLMWALEKFDEVYTVGFEYGQKHSVEMECRQKILQSIESIKPNWMGGRERKYTPPKVTRSEPQILP